MPSEESTPTTVPLVISVALVLGLLVLGLLVLGLLVLGLLVLGLLTANAEPTESTRTRARTRLINFLLIRIQTPPFRARKPM